MFYFTCNHSLTVEKLAAVKQKPAVCVFVVVYEQQACYDEQLHHMGEDGTQPLDYDILKDCVVLDRCLKETLRLRPPICTMMRMCKTPQVISSHLLFNEITTCARRSLGPII